MDSAAASPSSSKDAPAGVLQPSSLSFSVPTVIPTTLDVSVFYATVGAKKTKSPAPSSPKKEAGRFAIPGKPVRSHPFLRDKVNVSTNSQVNKSIGYWIDSQGARVYVNELYLTPSQNDRKQMQASRNLFFVPHIADSVLQQDVVDLQPSLPSLPSPSRGRRSPRSRSSGHEVANSPIHKYDDTEIKTSASKPDHDDNAEISIKTEEDSDFCSFLQAVEGLMIEDVLEIQKHDPFASLIPDIFKATSSSRSWANEKVLHGKEKIAHLKMQSKKCKKFKPIDKSSNLTMKTALVLSRSSNHVEVFKRLMDVFQEKKSIEAARAAWESMKARYSMHISDKRAKIKVAPRYLDYMEEHHRNIATAKGERKAREDERLRADAEKEASKKRERRRKWRKAQGYDTEEDEEEVAEELAPAGESALAEAVSVSTAVADAEKTGSHIAEPATVTPAIMEPATVTPAIMEPATVTPAIMEPATVTPAIMEPAKGEPVAEKVPEVIRDVFDDLRGTEERVSVSILRSWGDVADMVTSGVLAPAQLDAAIASVAGADSSLGLQQLFAFLGILDKITDGGGEDEDEDVHDLAKGNQAARLARLLNRKPGLLNLRNGKAETPLHKACAYSAFDAAKVLLGLQADMGAADKYGDVPLHCACTEGHWEVCSMLVLQGADIYVRNLDNKKPLDLCKSREMAEQLRSLYVKTLQGGVGQ